MPSSQAYETTSMYPPQPFLFCCRDQVSRAGCSAMQLSSLPKSARPSQSASRTQYAASRRRALVKTCKSWCFDVLTQARSGGKSPFGGV